MNISIFGLGYVGAVITGCFAKQGHRVIGVDTEATKVALINSGKSPIIEPELDGLIADGVRAGRISATTDFETAVLGSDLSMICVGTPSKPAGDLDLSFVARVCEAIGSVLKTKKERHLVVARSTMLPGSVEGTLIPALERTSGKKAGPDFGVAINPEFLRESTAVYDFYNPPKTVIGAAHEADAAAVASLYDGLNAPRIVTSLKAAEMVKYADNIFHALKVTFANEIGTLCKTRGIDSQEVMRIFCEDKKLNLSPAYLKPGFAFGGSCLPKDLRALTRFAVTEGVAVPMLAAITESNEQQIRAAINLVASKNRRRIGVLGFAFKGGTDDLRESPVVTLIEALLGKGFEIKLYDSYVSLARLIGANRQYIEQRIPHIARLMVDSIDEIVESSELILIGNQSAEFDGALQKLSPDQQVIDLTPGTHAAALRAGYERIAG
jgi:GDP-mannose 6-dehydrogenase